jgi:flagellar protein FlbT
MLRISLRDGERMIVNGSVLRANGRVSILVENQSAILRDRDVMQADEANTPAKRLYFACMLAYIHPEQAEQQLQRIAELAGELYAVLAKPELRQHSLDMLEFSSRGEFYKALIECRKIMHYENEVLGRMAESLPDPYGYGAAHP